VSDAPKTVEEIKAFMLHELRQLEVDTAVRRARAAGLTVDPEDVDVSSEEGALIDGMPADDWISHMTG
jgi:hypothetical protein